MSNDNLMSLVVDGLLPEVIHEPEEPDSAFEATQYFFEDITPDTSMGESSFQNLLFRVTESYVHEQEAFHTFSALLLIQKMRRLLRSSCFACI